MKKILCTIALLLYLINNILAEGLAKKVFINKVVEHPALNMTTKGIIEGLEKHGYKAGENLDLRVESSQANPVLSSQIAVKFIDQSPDVVVGIGTIAAQSFSKFAKNNKAKLVFSSVTDPVSANLIQNINKPGNNTSGVSNFLDLEPQLNLFKTIQPNLKKLGILYNQGEANSLIIVKKLKEVCRNFDIILIEQSANKTSEVAQATSKLSNSVDAIFISNDNTALASLKTIINIASKSKIPVYVSDTDAVKLGALAGLGPNQYKIGVQTAEIIIKIFNGEDLNNIPVEFANNVEIYLNEKKAKELSIELSDELKNKATIITEQD